MGRNPLAHPRNQRLLEVFDRLALAQHHVSLDRLAARLVGLAHRNRLQDGRVADQAFLDLEGADAVAARGDDIVRAGGEEDVAVFVHGPFIAGQHPVADELGFGFLG